MSGTLYHVLVALAVALAAAAPQADPSSAPYRYRAAIAALLQLKPGMIAAEVGATPKVIAPEMASLVGANGRVIDATVDRSSATTNLDTSSVDAIALVTVLTIVSEPKPLFDSLARALRPGGVLLVVDVPQENDGKRTIGLEAEDVTKLAAAVGLKREAESGIVPGHYAIRFRKDR